MGVERAGDTAASLSASRVRAWCMRRGWVSDSESIVEAG